ncbi:MAG: NAD(P)/FAD-dependent oxidoreductase [Duncaniella sp.]|nr:NAD(P)/FAD-dependent oxidoreductase [Duncaniella sp.]MDE6465842.1 NAD(P)/FAD-dependent oxidoreductase [Duncaniella sp.]MDE6573609.1 NAD(P)/FAD-dependent oxidoreductase [Duncaniella sp.]
MAQKEKIVILGGGFAGLNVLKEIDNKKFEVHIVDRNNYHCFPPLFYQVASSGLEPTDIAFPFRQRVGKGKFRDTRFHLGEIKEIDYSRRIVITDHEEIRFDHLVIALGTTNNFFADNSLANKVYTLKSIGESLRLRNEIISRCERAAIEKNPAKRQEMLTFVVIGGGPAGVEVAGALGELKRYILRREYPEISPSEMTIRIIEGSPRLLASMSEKSSKDALDGLNKLLVDVTLGHVMKSYDGNNVELNDGTCIKSSLVVWTAGVKAVRINITGCDTSSMFGHGGRIITDSCCRVVGLDRIYAVGDIGIHTDKAIPRGLPQLAQVAIQQGKYISHCINHNNWSRPFSYDDRGSMATIGRNKAVADIGRMHFGGWIGWMTWMFVHLVSLMGMRSKMSVLLNWTWSYFTYNSALRILLRAPRQPETEN